MRQLTLIAVLAAIFVNSLFAQFATGGTQISYASSSNHRAFVSAVPGGSYYVTWMVTEVGNINIVKLGGYDSRGVVLPGWTSGGKNIGPSTGTFYSPQIITTEDSGVIIVWHGTLGDSTFSRIFAQKYTLSGQALWNGGNPLQVTTGIDQADQNPMVINDGKNGAFIAWTRYDLALDPSSADVYMQHITGTGTVASGWNSSATAVAATPGLQECWPQLTLTPDLASLYVTYSSGPAQATSLVINKFDASTGASATGWTNAAKTISSGPNVMAQINCNHKLYTDNAGNAVVFWLEQRVTVGGEVYMQQVSPSGSDLLTANGQMLAGDLSSGEGVNYLEVVRDNNQNFLITYNNLVTNNDVGAMCVQSNGSVLWADSLVTTGGASGFPVPVSDGNGGMYIFYANTNSPEKLYGLAIDNTGTAYKGWTLPGSSFGAVNNYDPANPNYDINAVASDNGQAIVTWNRLTTSGYYEVYTCNLFSNGKTCSQCIPVNTNLQGNITLCQGHPLTLSITPDPNFQYAWLINGNSSIDSSSSIHVADSGSYVVIVHSLQQNCSDTSNMVTVSLSPSPQVTLGAFSVTSVCNNAQPITLEAGSPVGGIFSGNGVTSAGVFTPSFSNEGDNVILYTYTNGEGCSNSAAQSITVNNCTGINEVSAQNTLSVYPNPADKYLVISSNSGALSGNIQILDVTGRVILNVIGAGNNMQLETGRLSAGVYFLAIGEGQNRAITKFAISRP